jgi:hypothetical protein
MQGSLHCWPIPNWQSWQYRSLQAEPRQLPSQALSQSPQLQDTQSLAQPLVQQEKLLVPLLPLQKLWQHDLRASDLHWSQISWLHAMPHWLAISAVQLASHSDGQSLHNGFFLGCPWEDMSSTAKTAMAAAALRPAAPETIVVVG